MTITIPTVIDWGICKWQWTSEREISKRELKIMLDKNDCKKWIIGFEVGKNGLRHYQVRLVTSNDNFFEWVKAHIPTAHIEKANQGWSDYERKSGRFITSDDTAEIRQVRFGTLRPLQKKILKIVGTQNDRQIDVFLDSVGNHGKSWLTIHLWERGQALVVPRSESSAAKISAFICSAWRGEPFIIIDIPRASKPKPEWYEAIEELKDGLVFDGRYSGRCRNIRGCKLIIFTNVELDLKRLSHDRWRLHGVSNSLSP